MHNSEFPKEISLCLGGGAARGAFHLGVVSVLQENNIEIKAISGTSVGAFLGASLACGKSAQEIYKIVRSKEFKKDVFKFQLFKGYLFEIDADAKIMDKLIDKKSFEELQIPLSVTITNLDEERAEYVTKGSDLKKFVLASCSITPVFKPVKLHDRLLVDGGIIDNFPVEQLQKYPYPILGINLYPKHRKKVHSILGWIRKNIYIAWQSHNRAKKDLCDIYICSDAIHKIKAFSFRDIDEAYEMGRDEMQKYFKST